jgi:hypothetical protein
MQAGFGIDQRRQRAALAAERLVVGKCQGRQPAFQSARIIVNGA